jgi:hypothetical protein
VNVLVDTSVWSIALRRARRLDGGVAQELADLIDEGRVVMLGPVRQELLSGIKERVQFDRLRDRLRAFPDVALEVADHELAAELFNRCRAGGVQGSNTDLLLCAVAARRHLAVFTTDGDFQHFAAVIPLVLHAVRG